MRKTLLPIFILFALFSAARADMRDSVDEASLRIQKEQIRKIESDVEWMQWWKDIDDATRSVWMESRSWKGAWRWSLEELMMFRTGQMPLIPEFYFDDADGRGSNGGWLLT